MPLLQSVVGDRRLRFTVDQAEVPIRRGTALAVLVNELFRRLDLDAISVRTNQPYLPALTSFFEARARRLRH